ncbi:zinc ribbon domain-containing protein [Streptomyces sp. S.PNR 29]|uniref:zinc ribbon domain-containing protein n=1 Tax=Streptomyces sp. S.PNR 29 TaxID=2973805 RepID=UPI0025B1AD94|nr:zinc ribbon domain-containing protein [Streptomyces sp. S.PNR 29]MDN0198348.1 zinc ribbon domain-containing protein [Streptomyces sp. S.PNR 29]
MRACPACGASNGSTDDFCGNCGAYLGWSDTTPAASTPSAPPDPPDPTPPDATPAPASTPADEPASAAPDHSDEDPGVAPGQAETGPEPETRPGDVRTEPPAPTHRPDPAGSGPAASATEARPPQAPATPSVRIPGPRRPATPAPEEPAVDPVPVRPAKPVAPRPVVRPVEVPDEEAGVPCPACGTANPPDRRFCRRCATALHPAAKPAPLPWWRTVWPLRRRVRASSGRVARLLVVLAVVAALCAGGLLLLPAGRALIEDTRDKLGKAKPVTPVDIEASGDVPRHPAANTTDGLSNSYWGAPAPGASVTYTFRKPFRLLDLIITNGASASPEDYARQGRALRLDLEVTTQDGERHRKELTLSDKPGPQTFPTGVSDAKTVRLVLHSPAGLSSGRHLALAEVEFFQRS